MCRELIVLIIKEDQIKILIDLLFLPKRPLYLDYVQKKLSAKH